MSIGTLYQYFSSKEAIVAALAERHLRGEQAIILASLQEIGSLDSESLPLLARRLIKGVFLAHQHEPQLHRALMRLMPDDSLAATKDTIAAAIQVHLSAHLDDFRVHDPGLAAFVVVELIDAAVQRATLTRPELLQDDRLVDELTDVVVRYLMP